MSAHAIGAPVGAAGRDARPSLARLTKVELRKMVNTRSGFWLVLAVVGLTLLSVLITALAAHEDQKTFSHILSNALAPAGILLPVIGILLVSSEWSQRTALVSFALVPGRARLIGAKVLAGIALALAATVVAVVLAAFGTAIASTDVAHQWSLPLGLLLQDVFYVVISMVIGIAFGAALLSSAPAIVVYFAVPIALSALGSIHSIAGVIEWINVGESAGPLTERLLSGQDWGQVMTTLVVWLVIPLAIGLWRITRRDLAT
jgi:ABC-type transport system involved in multi-copper enzyme maturation permease subunit